MTILGIDPGTTAIGYGVLRKSSGRGGALEVLDFGVIETTGEQSDKLLQIDNELSKIMKKHKPDLGALETLYFSKNKKTAIAVAEARGVITLALKKAGVPFKEFSPNNVKSIVTGYGGSDKTAVKKMVALTLGLKTFTAKDDASDALALAIRGAAEVLTR